MMNVKQVIKIMTVAITLQALSLTALAASSHDGSHAGSNEKSGSSTSSKSSGSGKTSSPSSSGPGLPGKRTQGDPSVMVGHQPQISNSNSKSKNVGSKMGEYAQSKNPSIAKDSLSIQSNVKSIADHVTKSPDRAPTTPEQAEINRAISDGPAADMMN